MHEITHHRIYVMQQEASILISKPLLIPPLTTQTVRMRIHSEGSVGESGHEKNPVMENGEKTFFFQQVFQKVVCDDGVNLAFPG